MSGLYAPPQTCEEDRAFSTQLMGAVGKLCWLEQESDINGVIASARSTPAYFSCLWKPCSKRMVLGFDETTARTLVQQAAALQVFAQQELPRTVASAMQAAVARAEEMEKLF